MTQSNFNWLDRSEYPFAPNYISQNGVNQHYIDEGNGEVILFVHGTPSWSFDFRNVIKLLSKKYRCVAIDHVGFGLSDKPKEYDYSVINHSKNLEQIIAHLGLKNITIVLHDFGGPIGFDYAIKYPENISKMVVMNSWLWSSSNDPDYIKFSKILKSPLLPFLYRYLNFSPKFLLPQSFGDKKISGRLLKQYTSPFQNAGERNGTLAFAKSLLNDQEWFQKLWEKRNSLNDKNFLLIWGMKDKFVSAKYLEKFSSGFPNMTAKKLATCGHFPQEEMPVEVADAIEKFLS